MGSFAAMIQRTAGNDWPGTWTEIDCQRMDSADPSGLSGIVVTGSAASVTEDAAWMNHTAELLRAAVDQQLPVLGICFGHQLLAHALGGEVTRNPLGREIGTVSVEVLVTDPLLGETRTILVQATHVDSVVKLPPGAAVLGRSRLEPCAALRFAPYAWGVQFHPEFQAELVRHYLRERSSALLEEGLDPVALAEATQEAPEGAEVLRRFVRLVAERGG